MGSGEAAPPGDGHDAHMRSAHGSTLWAHFGCILLGLWLARRRSVPVRPGPHGLWLVPGYPRRFPAPHAGAVCVGFDRAGKSVAAVAFQQLIQELEHTRDPFIEITTMRREVEAPPPHTPARRAGDPPGIDYSHRRRLAAMVRWPSRDPDSDSGEIIELIVRDNGPGLPPELIDDIEALLVRGARDDDHHHLATLDAPRHRIEPDARTRGGEPVEIAHEQVMRCEPLPDLVAEYGLRRRNGGVVRSAGNEGMLRVDGRSRENGDCGQREGAPHQVSSFDCGQRRRMPRVRRES